VPIYPHQLPKHCITNLILLGPTVIAPRELFLAEAVWIVTSWHHVTIVLTAGTPRRASQPLTACHFRPGSASEVRLDPDILASSHTIPLTRARPQESSA
jgi:hypothetical protein